MVAGFLPEPLLPHHTIVLSAVRRWSLSKEERSFPISHLLQRLRISVLPLEPVPLVPPATVSGPTRTLQRADFVSSVPGKSLLSERPGMDVFPPGTVSVRPGQWVQMVPEFLRPPIPP